MVPLSPREDVLGWAASNSGSKWSGLSLCKRMAYEEYGTEWHLGCFCWLVEVNLNASLALGRPSGFPKKQLRAVAPGGSPPSRARFAAPRPNRVFVSCSQCHLPSNSANGACPFCQMLNRSWELCLRCSRLRAGLTVAVYIIETLHQRTTRTNNAPSNQSNRVFVHRRDLLLR